MVRTGPQGARDRLRIGLPGPGARPPIPTRADGRVHVAETFRRLIEATPEPGTPVDVNEDTLRRGGTGRGITLIEDDAAP